ncbi:hypothetical protein [Iodobacter sp.]|uniref:hypothetical protein n=1 Tax=Iodobacter sp. TaxID=1915058 RepID=UPI0025D7E4B3|nr:hypothetical protein [Iodobacter sp.]
MPSIRERILNTLQARLDAALTVPVYRAPILAARRENMPLLILEPQAESVESIAGELSERQLSVVLHVLTRGDLAHQQADELQVSANQAMLALSHSSEPAFLIHEVDCDWDFEDADSIAEHLVTRYQIRYLCNRQDLSQGN